MSDLNNLPGSVCAMKPWLVFIQDYNLTQVEANLKMAWSKFGQGKIHNRDYFFKNYLYVLGNLTQDIVPFVSTTKKWTKALHDQWTSLFGSPNPVLFPDFPFNQLTAQYSQNYALQVKELKILASNQPVKGAMEEAFCTENGNILEKSLVGFQIFSFTDFRHVDRPSSGYPQLYLRATGLGGAVTVFIHPITLNFIYPIRGVIKR